MNIKRFAYKIKQTLHSNIAQIQRFLCFDTHLIGNVILVAQSSLLIKRLFQI